MDNDISPVDKVVALPFPIFPRRVLYGELAKVLRFIAWKERNMAKTNGEAEKGKDQKTLEEIQKLSIAEQKLWVIKRLLEVIEYADREDLQRLYEILTREPPEGA
jgi:hypothetical protein